VRPITVRGRLAAPTLTVLLCAALATAPVAAAPDAPYVPGRGSWEAREAEAVGMDGAALDRAVAVHRAHESPRPRDQELGQAQSFGREPYGEGIGPFAVRGEVSGLVVRHGYLVREWGDTRAVEMAHSVTKSFLSTVLGVAWSDGRLRLDEPVHRSMAPLPLPAGDGELGVDRTAFGAPDATTLFTTPRHRRITWEHLLRQSSDWAGTLWGKPDWADRPSADPGTWLDRPRHEPGTVYEYNDTRVNLLALAATSLLRRPLPEVLRERIMEPVGASPTWRWYGYENAWIPLDGHMVQSVSGGGHWGGGMFVSARDMARLGLLSLRRGSWGEARLVDAAWYDHATRPGPANRTYGFMNYFLNGPDEAGERRWPSAPAGAWAFLGNGTNLVYVDPEHDLVVVARWITGAGIDPFLGAVLDAVRD
jgi:CubicO group peptidase (beta-lactamase class C family)